MCIMQCDFGYDAPDHFRRLDSIPDTFPINRKHNDELSVHVRVSVRRSFVETVSGELLLFMNSMLEISCLISLSCPHHYCVNNCVDSCLTTIIDNREMKRQILWNVEHNRWWGTLRLTFGDTMVFLIGFFRDGK